MCINPTVLPSGYKVPCRRCWQCLSERTNDLVGRAIAESKSCALTVVLTLTYGRDEHGAALHGKTMVHCKADLKRYLQSWRNDGYKIRYMIAGEFGSERGRAHWHAVLFFHTRKAGVAWPEFVYDTECQLEKHWPHGYTYAQRPTYQNLSYAIKYAVKEYDGLDSAFTRSTRPPLGMPYFVQRAEQLVRARLPLRDANYEFPEILKSNGDRREFWLSRRALDYYVEAYKGYWADYYGTYPPSSEFLENWEDKQARFEIPLDEILAEGHLKQRRPPPIATPVGCRLRYDRKANNFYVLDDHNWTYWLTEIEGGKYIWSLTGFDASADEQEQKPKREKLVRGTSETYVQFRLRQLRIDSNLRGPFAKEARQRLSEFGRRKRRLDESQSKLR